MLQKLKNLVKQFLGRFPSRLPDSKQGFIDYTTEVLNTYGLPDNDSYRFAVATMVLHLPPERSSKPKYYFANALRKSQSNEIAYAIVQELKEKQKQEATQPSVANVQSIQGT